MAGPELLDAANAFEGASINAAFIVGPALAGLIAAARRAAAAIEVQIVTAWRWPSDRGRSDIRVRPEHAEAPTEGMLHAVAQGLRATWQIRPLRWNLTIDVFYVLAWSTLNVGFPAFALAVGAGAHAAGYMWAAVAAGSMLGGFALAGRPRPRPLSDRRLLLAMAASAALWPLAGKVAVALVLIFLTGVLDGPGLVGLISIRQRLAPAHLRAQIFSTANSLHSAVIAAGAAGAGLFQRAFGTDATLLLWAALIAVAGAIALLSQTEPGGVTASALAESGGGEAGPAAAWGSRR